MIAASPAAAGERIELADVLNRYGDAYMRDHYLRSSQAKVVNAIRCCRTAALGGHCEWCSGCGFLRYAYHSCRNRHCPKCQTLAKQQWVLLRRRELLPVPYFHNVFTLPHELNPIILYLSLIGLEPATQDRVIPAGERSFSDRLLSIIRLISSLVVVASSWTR